MNNSKKVWNVIAIIAIVIAVILGINLYNKNTSYANVVQNDNNKAFYEVVDRIQNSKIYLAKSILLSPNVHYIHYQYKRFYSSFSSRVLSSFHLLQVLLQ